MRKALFAIVLVAASFAGGAVVNGPGLRWAQTQLMSHLGMDDVEPIARDANASTEEIPSRPIPPLVIEPAAPGKTATVVEASRPDSTPSASTARHDDPPSNPKALASSSKTSSALPGLAPVPEGPSLPTLDPVPPVSTAREAGPAETPPLAAAMSGPDVETPKARGPDTGKSDDAAVKPASVPNLSDSVPPEAPTQANPGGGDWAEVREAMRKLGVSRYGIDGDPAGRVRFYCVIPLAGRRAVGQQFEAEGDDDLQAARTALKRVALWRAASGTP